MSKLTNNHVLFVYLFKNNKTFEWTNECEETFKKLKEYLVTPPILTRLKARETFYVYLATLDKVVSSVVIKEEGDV